MLEVETPSLNDLKMYNGDFHVFPTIDVYAGERSEIVIDRHGITVRGTWHEMVNCSQIVARVLGSHIF